ncbi:MarR family transcriptional regulator [Paractinoplanes ferrugineus]|uniref:HTH-type transcriptional regulator YcgE n=1 Tax=Paractinoplanes ferrugineus TaxID=113564 RepID=A0A919MFD9_9ACTN|nr:MarR family transcriptional regulator [Actinoplanes ferrugineus]GIE13698.1 putative HTH-type transcriptional regulator YcgE [Actinoplanes ferrugineus]
MSSQESPAPRDRQALVAEFDEGMRALVSRSVLFHHAVADRLGINVSDLNCLGILEMTGPTTAGTLAEQTGLTTGAITGALDRLESAGYARRERDVNDRRRVIVRPLEGAAEIYRFFASLGAATEKLFERYTDEQLEVLVDFVERAGPITYEEMTKLRAWGDGAGRLQKERPAGQA